MGHGLGGGGKREGGGGGGHSGQLVLLIKILWLKQRHLLVLHDTGWWCLSVRPPLLPPPPLGLDQLSNSLFSTVLWYNMFFWGDTFTFVGVSAPSCLLKLFETYSNTLEDRV